MKKNNWTIGKGIAVAGKWLAIMGMVIALFGFIQFVLKFQAGYYDRPEVCLNEEPLKPIPNTEQYCPEGFEWDEEERRCLINE